MTVQLFKQTLEALERGDDLPADSREWIRKAFLRYQFLAVAPGQHRRRDLESLLGLSIPVTPGSRYQQPIQVDLVGQRNHLIQILADELPGQSAWRKAKQLSVLIRRYPSSMEQQKPKVRELLDELMSEAMKPPKSARQLLRILEGERGWPS